MEEKLPPKNRNLHAKMAFSKACSKLNQYNLTDLWTVSALLSIIDYFDSLDEGVSCIFPMINFQKINIFNKAILASSARDYKTKIFDKKYLSYIFNNLVNATDSDELVSSNSDPETRLISFFAKMFNSQIPYQHINIPIYLARAYALYEYYPNILQDSLQQKHKDHFVDIPNNFQEIFGITIKEYLHIGFVFFSTYFQLFNEIFKPNLKIRESLIEKRKLDEDIDKFQSKIINDLVDSSIKRRHKLIISLKNLGSSDNKLINDQKVRNFLKIVSKTSKELSLLQSEKPFNQGDLLFSISPLERYPIVKIDKDRYIIPNIRYFAISLCNIIHYALQEKFLENQFNETYGSVFEYYVQELIKNRTKGKTFIPETRYKKSKNFIDGPDLTILDKSEESITLIEIKAKNITLASKQDPLSDSFIKDMRRVFNALSKLPEKLNDLYNDFKEYSEWQKDIKSIPKENSQCFVVMGQGLVFMSGIINKVKSNIPDHFLNQFPYKYGVFTIDKFEEALELVYDENISLTDLLTNYWKASISDEVTNYNAEQFGGLVSDSNDYFLKKFLDLLIKDIANSIDNK